jgi:hypothetical protein
MSLLQTARRLCELLNRRFAGEHRALPALSPDTRRARKGDCYPLARGRPNTRPARWADGRRGFVPAGLCGYAFMPRRPRTACACG